MLVVTTTHRLPLLLRLAPGKVSAVVRSEARLPWATEISKAEGGVLLIMGLPPPLPERVAVITFLKSVPARLLSVGGKLPSAAWMMEGPGMCWAVKFGPVGLLDP